MRFPHAAAGAVVAAVLAGAAACATPAPDSAAADEALYQKRFAVRMSASGARGAYDPLRAVPGAQAVRRLPTASQAERTVTDAALDKARAYAAANNSSAFIVWRKGEVQTADYFGDATAATPLVSFSLAKPMSVIAVGRAMQLGHIKSLDQPVADFITEWKGTPKAAMTLRHLLQMRSGLLRQGSTLEEANDPNDVRNRAYLGARIEDTLVKDYPLTHPPGERFDYSNANGELVSVIIGRATGKDYARFVSEEVLKPLGATGGEVWIDRPGGLAHAGCCMMLPAETWLRLGILVEQDGQWDGRRLLPDGFVKAMGAGSPVNPHYGMGLYIGAPYVERRGFANPDVGLPGVLHGEPYAAPDLVLFDGNANQVVYIVPSAELVILRMGAAPPKSPEWDNAVLPNIILRGLKGGG